MEEQLIQRLVESNVLKSEDVVGGCHSMTPSFLAHQLECSLFHLGVETLDLFYLHNCVESQLSLVGRATFMERLSKAFEFLEGEVQKGRIRYYGMASWVCFRA